MGFWLADFTTESTENTEGTETDEVGIPDPNPTLSDLCDLCALCGEKAFYPLTAPEVRPLMNSLCRAKNSTAGGIMANAVPVKNTP
jgi:hypothetical protein